MASSAAQVTAKASPSKVSKGGQGQPAAAGRFVMPWNKPMMAGGGGGGGGDAAMPEWKLNCLCAEYGLPPTVRGNLKLGGCF